MTMILPRDTLFNITISPAKESPPQSPPSSYERSAEELVRNEISYLNPLGRVCASS